MKNPNPNKPIGLSQIVTVKKQQMTLALIPANQEEPYVKSSLLLPPLLDSSPKNTLPEILFISTFPPTECGIATYTKDLIDALRKQFSNSFQCTVCALESSLEPLHQPLPGAKYKLNTHKQNDYLKLAFKINENANIQLLVIQHEFGLFSQSEEYFQTFYNNIIKPIVFVFHTVLPSPNETLLKQVNNMTRAATSIVVMTENAKHILIQDYHVRPLKIQVIPHGTHLLPFLNKTQLKTQYKLTGKTILSTFGLLGSSKSIETTLYALPQIVQLFPKVVFLILGKTHPNVRIHEGEAYRNKLQHIVKELQLQNHVRFVNEYLPINNLLEYLNITDIYLFTSKDPNQAVSGTFSYAASSGCPIISTRIPHAVEVLGHNNGIIIDFEDYQQLAQSVIALLNSATKRETMASNGFQIMAATSWPNSAIKHAILFQQICNKKIQLQYNLPPINLSHLQQLTTSFGLLQFSKFSNPDKASGYTLDDNARALIALCKYYQTTRNPKDLARIQLHLDFIAFCWQNPQGRFLNYVNSDHQFTQQNFEENLEDSNGRAMWALGVVASMTQTLPPAITNIAKSLMDLALPHLKSMHSTRAMAFLIKGLYHAKANRYKDSIGELAQRLANMYNHEKTLSWHWFEDSLTYGNAVIPESMLCAYLATNNMPFRNIALESFHFLLETLFFDNKINVISNQGWLKKDAFQESHKGGEQPIDVAYTILALERFYETFASQDYLKKASTAFSWFHGNNHLHQIIYNPATGGCYDGLELENVNLNQGAESTISYLLASLTMHDLSRKAQALRSSN